MPGNDLGDRVHNFFAQDNLSQGQHHSQVVEGNWPVLNSNFWVGNQGQIVELSSHSKNYNSHNSGLDVDSHHVTNGLNLTQSNLRPDLAKHQSLNERPSWNGFMHANQFHQARQNEANFLGVDTSLDYHLMTSRGFLAAEVLQGSGTVVGHQTKVSDRSETSVSPASFDFFGGQHQTNHQQSSTVQPFLHQHSGINNTQQLQQQQQQLMIRKLQETQQQQQTCQLDLRQQFLSGQVPSFAKQNSGGQSSLVNGTTIPDSSQYPWTTGKNWLNQGSLSMQGSPNGLGFPTNLGQSQGLVDLVPQHADKSLYGVPVSSSRGLNINHESQLGTSRASIPQTPMSSNFLPVNQPNLLPEQVGVQGESSMSRHKFRNDDILRHSSKQSQNLGLGNMGGLQQLNSVSRNAPQESSQEKPTKRIALPQKEVVLDPTEEKILFGSDDNIWAAFGNVPNGSGEASELFDNDGSNGLASIQNGSWSALMQSAVAETSSSDKVPQDEWSGLTSQKNGGLPWSQPPSFPHNNFRQEKPIIDVRKQMPSELNSGSFPTSGDISSSMTLNQQRQKFQDEPGQRLQTLIAEGSQFSDASQHSLQAERSVKNIGFCGKSGSTIQSNGWNALAGIPHEGDSLPRDNDAENLRQNSKDSQVRAIQGEVFHGSSLQKLNSVPGSSMELGNVKSGFGNSQANQRILSLKDTASVEHNGVIGAETSSQFQNNYSLSQRTNVHSSARSGGGESLGKLMNLAKEPSQVLEAMSGHEKDEVARCELENHDAKENSTDSHQSSLSQHIFGGFREGGVPDVRDSRSLSVGKQKIANQLPRKASAPRKFQYHPMGNVDEDVEPAYGLKQPSHMQTMLLKNVHFGQSRIFGQATQNSTLNEKGQSSEFRRDIKMHDVEPSRGDLSANVPNRPVSHCQSVDSLNNMSSSSQNMLELFKKVDHSRNHGAIAQLDSPEPSSQLHVGEKYDVFGRLQPNHSHVSQGFGLQLGPPSQRLQISDHSLSSQNGQQTFNSLCSNNATPEKGDKSRKVVAKQSVQSLPSSEETLPDFKLNISTVPEHGGIENSQHKTPGNLTPSFTSGNSYSRCTDQNHQITRVSGQNQSIDTFSENASRSAQIRADASGRFQEDNHTSFGAMSQHSGPNNVQERVPTATITARDSQQVPYHSAIPGLPLQGYSLQMLHNMGTNVPMHKLNMSSKIQQNSSRILELAQPNIVESTVPLMHDHVNSHGVDGEEKMLGESAGQLVESANTEAVPEVEKSLGQTLFLKNHLDESPSSSTSMQKDIEAFGRSLKPNSFSHQNYTSLNQMQRAPDDAEIDSSSRVSKRMKGLENVVDVHHAAFMVGQQHEHNDVLRDSLASSSPTCLLQTKGGNGASQDNLGLNQDTSQKSSCINFMTSSRVDHPQVSPQMAPSWVSQYGSLKNGKMVQLYDALNVTPSRPGDQSLPRGKGSSGFDPVSSEEKRATVPADTCQNSIDHEVASGDISSLKSLQLNVTGQNLAILTSKKRKSAILDLNPWHKEISEVSQYQVAHSITELDWDKASNCLTVNVDGDAEDGFPVLRCKQRLILTTRLIRKLLQLPSAPAAILSADAAASYEAPVYAVSMTTLGDACSTVCYLSNLDLPCDGIDLHPRKGNLSVRNGVRHAKAAEELLGRIRKLEGDFSRLGKSASIVDLRLECQDLEKISVINRFARFHGRGQSDITETSSSQRSIPQRYVTAIPLPRNIPDEVQCLPL